MMLSSIPGMSDGFQANKSTFFFRIEMILSFSSTSRLVPKLVVYWASSPIWIDCNSSMGLTLLSWNSSLGS
ncbi:hypothetical protein A2U01_0070827, partial [Trifolium medium]|nr:hypothetical protein [Trifolium medium]